MERILARVTEIVGVHIFRNGAQLIAEYAMPRPRVKFHWLNHLQSYFYRNENNRPVFLSLIGTASATGLGPGPACKFGVVSIYPHGADAIKYDCGPGNAKCDVCGDVSIGALILCGNDVSKSMNFCGPCWANPVIIPWVADSVPYDVGTDAVDSIIGKIDLLEKKRITINPRKVRTIR